MAAAVAQVTYRVLDAGYDLRTALAEGLDAGAAADRLAAVIEASTGYTHDVVQGFEASSSPVTRGQEDVEDLLAVAVGQLCVAEVALSAGGAVGEHAGAEATGGGGVDALDTALAGVGTTAAGLAGAVDDTRFGFDTASATPRPTDLPAAVTLLGERAIATLDLVTERTAEILTQATPALFRLAPAALRDAWKQIEEKFDLGGVGGRLTALGLRALEAALGALHRVVPVPALRAARGHVHDLRERLASDEPMTVVTRWMLAVDAAAAAVEADLARDGLQVGRLTLAASSLDDLSTRCRRVMDLVAGASIAIIGVGAVAVLLPWTVPNLAVVLTAAQLLVLAAAVVLGREFVDSAAGVGRVRGVRVIVREAVDPT